MLEITGLDSLVKELDDAQKALEAVNGELGTLTFNPSDPASIEGAIADAQRLVDDRLGPYASNSIVKPLMQQMKDHFRQAVLDKAAEERAKEGEADAN